LDDHSAVWADFVDAPRHLIGDQIVHRQAESKARQSLTRHPRLGAGLPMDSAANQELVCQPIRPVPFRSLPLEAGQIPSNGSWSAKNPDRSAQSSGPLAIGAHWERTLVCGPFKLAPQRALQPSSECRILLVRPFKSESLSLFLSFSGLASDE